jgi:hypothetical protein
MGKDTPPPHDGRNVAGKMAFRPFGAGAIRLVGDMRRATLTMIKICLRGAFPEADQSGRMARRHI